jgi:chorismate mutase
VQIAAQMLERHLSIRIPAVEMSVLEQYCKKYRRSKTDVVREFIRSLAERM